MSNQNRIVFVGTGGSGGMVATQKLVTGGTYFEYQGMNFYIDPGPGAVLRSRQIGVPLETLDAVFLTHNHLDHHHDIWPMIEAWHDPSNPKDNRKLLFATKEYFTSQPMPDFLKNSINEIHQVGERQEYKIEKIKVTTSKYLVEKPHYADNMPEVVGYMFEGGNLSVGFWSQSRYKPNITEGFKPDILIFDFWNLDNFAINEQVAIIKEINPKIIYLRHFSLPVYHAGIDKAALALAERVNAPVLLAPEGGEIEI